MKASVVGRRVGAATLLALLSGASVAAADDLVFTPLVPCRVADTRLAGGAFGPFEIRNFVFRGPTTNYSGQGGSPTGCNVPGVAGTGPFRNVARAVAVNVVAVSPQGPGNLRAWAPNDPEPNASILNYAQVPGLNLANGIVVPICDEESADPCVGDDMSVKADVSGTHVVIDVLGYFREPENLGDVTGVAAGSGLVGGGTAGELSLAVDFAGNGTAPTAAHSDHHHDGLYSPIGHNHDTLYSPLTHNHDALYSPLAHNHFAQTWTGSASGGLLVENTSAAVNATAIRARVTGTAAVSAFLAEATGATGNNEAVTGIVNSVTGTGVRGQVSSPTGVTRGVMGVTVSTQGMGVLGTSFATSGQSAGVRGNTRSPDGYGVWGETLEPTGAGIAVYGTAASSAGYAGFFTGGRNYFQGRTGLGATNPTNQLHVQASLNFDATPTAHVALLENSSTGLSADVLALQIRTAGVAGPANNFITFFDAAGASLGSIEGNNAGGVVLAGPGNDYAEWLPRRDAAERAPAPGDVVGLVGGRVGLAVPPGAQAMVVSTAPIVAGNDPGAARRRDHALVALLGQAEVRVRGTVSVGDFLVPSGANDGTALAVPPSQATPEALAQVVGQAWEATPGPGVRRVRALVGPYAELAALRRRLDALEERLAAR